ncbi:MAG: hypothetical protein JXM70_08440 [Pirellulales bacterium]|nr:hypothetical protein [Pirellulales bacterium]
MALHYYELNDGSDEVPNNLLAGMLRCRHSCNPDFEKHYPYVTKWYVEIDTAKALVTREIGLNDSGCPIVLGPFGRNDGLWTGLDGISGRDAPRISKVAFEEAWKSLEDIYRDKVPPKRIDPRIPICNQDQIMGQWSAYILHGPGGMSDQVISFLPDGKGFFEDHNVTLMYYDEFHWEIVERGLITIKGDATYEEDDTSRIVKLSSEFDYESIVAETQVHHSGAGTSIEVLYLPLNNEKRAWVANAYGRCSVPLSQIERPTFN